MVKSTESSKPSQEEKMPVTSDSANPKESGPFAAVEWLLGESLINTVLIELY